MYEYIKVKKQHRKEKTVYSAKLLAVLCFIVSLRYFLSGSS